MKGVDWPQVPELPFHSPEDKEEWCKFVCPKCGMEDDVPGFVVDEFLMGKKKGADPGVACPRCGLKMKYDCSYYKKPYCEQQD